MRLDDFMPKAIQEPKTLKTRMERDWIIYRDTRNALQFWIDCFWYYTSDKGSGILTFVFRAVVTRRTPRTGAAESALK